MGDEDETKPDNGGDAPEAKPGDTPEPEKGTETEEPKPASVVDQANEAAARLERANVKHAELIAKQEALQVKETLGGKAEAGAPPKEETPEEYSAKVMRGEVDGHTESK